jgi:hypothetical protein
MNDAVAEDAEGEQQQLRRDREARRVEADPVVDREVPFFSSAARIGQGRNNDPKSIHAGA